MKSNQSNTSPGSNKTTDNSSELIKYALLTYGSGKMVEPVKILEKWLAHPPDELVTIACTENLPSMRVSKLLSTVDVKSKVVNSIAKLSEVPAYVLTLPSLCERIEDLPLITELVLTEHLKIYPIDFPGIHSTLLPVFYYLCHEYYSPNGITTPILTEDKYVGFLRKVISEKIFDKTVFQQVELDSRTDRIKTIQSGFRPFMLLEDKFIDLPSTSTFDHSSRAFRINETDKEKSFRGDPRFFIPCAHIRSLSSEEFTHFLENSRLSKKDREGNKLIKLDDLQTRMINVGQKCITYREKMKITPIPNIHALFSEMLRLLAKSKTMDTTKVEKPGLMRFFESDSSIVYNEKKYTLRSGPYYDAVKIIAQQMLAGNPSVGKDFIFESCGIKSESIREGSVPKWFRKSGGDPKKFVEDGHLLSDKRGNCRLDVDKDCILILAHKPISKYDDV